jgi:hypothetical protein
MIDDGDLDTLLSAPLADVADTGFSHRVAARAEANSVWHEKWRERLTLFGPIAAVTAIVPFLPVAEFTNAAVRLTPTLASSAPIAFAVGILALTLSLDARLREAA